MSAPSLASTSQGTGSTITLPAGTSEGDYVFIFVAASGTGDGSKSNCQASISDSSGAYWAAYGGSSHSSTTSDATDVSRLLLRTITGTEGTITATSVSISSPSYVWLCFRFAGGHVGVEPSVTNLQSTGSTFSWGAITTTGADRLIVNFGMTGSPSSAIDTATVSGYTNVTGARSGSAAVRIWSKVQSTAGSSGSTVSSTVGSSGILDQYTLAFYSAVTAAVEHSWGTILG